MNLKIILSGIFILASPILAAADELKADEIAEIKRDIQQLVNDYAIYRDRHDAKGYSSLFAEDGCLTVRGNKLCGREALFERLANADASSVSMHIMTTSQVTVIDHHNAQGVHYAAVYTGTRTENKEGAIPVSGFSVLGQYHDRYVKTADGWKIKERVMQPVFTTAE